MIVLSVLVLSAGAAAPVMGQDANNSTSNGSESSSSSDVSVSIEQGDDEPTETPSGSSERIQSDLVLVDSEVDNSGTARLTLRNEGPGSMSLTLTDAGAVRDGGEVPRRTTILPEGVSTVTMPTTEVDGLRAVTVGTSETLYSVVFEGQGRSIFAAPAPNDRLALGIGVLLTLGAALAIAVRRDDLDDGGIRRVDE